jgi:hypothetical protein
MNTLINPACPACQNNIHSRAHKSQSQKCSRKKLQMSQAGILLSGSTKELPAKREGLNLCGFGVNQRRYCE